MFWITLLALYLVWLFAIALPLAWRLGAKGEVLMLNDVLTVQWRQVWKLLTLPFAVAKRRRSRKDTR